ncbi:MAG: helicase HerA-like domain-containing protein [Verrucomicrobiales bacterium]
MESVVHLSVSELSAAATQPSWTEAYLAGQAPRRQTASTAGPVLHATKLHDLAKTFVNWATASDHLPLSRTLEASVDIFAKLQELGAHLHLQSLVESNKLAEAEFFLENLQRLSEHFSEQRKQRPGQSWEAMYFAQELRLRDIILAEGHGRKLQVTGIVDTIRVLENSRIEVVDYKFTAGLKPESEFVQIAIYQRMLAISHPELQVHGCLEYLYPEIKSCPCDPSELQQIYQHYVVPAIDALLQKPSDKPRPAPKVQVGAQDSNVLLGSRPDNSEFFLSSSRLLRHTAVLGGSGSGKTTAALNIIEQLLEVGVPAVLLDRKGDLSRYADPDAWTSIDAPELQERADRMRHKVQVKLFTPGTRMGRGLRLPLAPAGLGEMEAELCEEACFEAASSLGSMLNLSGVNQQPRLAVLTAAFNVLAQRRGPMEIILQDLLELLQSDDPELLSRMGALDKKHAAALVQRLQSFEIINSKLLDPALDVFDCSAAFSVSDRVPLTIVNIKFLGDQETTLFWVAQFFLQMLRHVSRNPSPHLQGMLMIDEADMYLPASSKPATKSPLESLLKRARSGGLGLMLCTQSPGDLDYKGRDNILTWMLGLIKEPRALDKLKPLLSESGVAPEILAEQKVGQFLVAAEGHAEPLQSLRNFMTTKQLSEDQIRELAKRPV